jgi:hypothetical protein
MSQRLTPPPSRNAEDASLLRASFASHARSGLALLEDALAPLGSEPRLSDLRAAQSERALSKNREIARTILEAPLHDVTGRFGLDTVLWAHFAAASADTGESSEFLRRCGFDLPRLFDAYALLDELSPMAHTADCIFSNHRLFAEVPRLAIEPGALAAIIAAHVLPRHESRLAEQPRYALEWNAQRNYHELGDLFWRSPSGDTSLPSFSHHPGAPFSMTLHYLHPDGLREPQHTVSFYASAGDTLFINQWQSPLALSNAAPGKIEKRWDPHGLGWFDHKAVHIEIMRTVAADLGFDRLGILSAENNHWTKPPKPGGEVHLPLERARKIYDQAAERAGFSHSQADGNYYLEVAP